MDADECNNSLEDPEAADAVVGAVPDSLTLQFVPIDRFSRSLITGLGNKAVCQLTMKSTKKWEHVIGYFEKRWGAKVIEDHYFELFYQKNDKKLTQNLLTQNVASGLSVWASLEQHPNVAQWRDCESSSQLEDSAMMVPLFYALRDRSIHSAGHVRLSAPTRHAHAHGSSKRSPPPGNQNLHVNIVSGTGHASQPDVPMAAPTSRTRNLNPGRREYIAQVKQNIAANVTQAQPNNTVGIFPAGDMYPAGYSPQTGWAPPSHMHQMGGFGVPIGFHMAPTQNQYHANVSNGAPYPYGVNPMHHMPPGAVDLHNPYAVSGSHPGMFGYAQPQQYPFSSHYPNQHHYQQHQQQHQQQFTQQELADDLLPTSEDDGFASHTHDADHYENNNNHNYNQHYNPNSSDDQLADNYSFLLDTSSGLLMSPIVDALQANPRKVLHSEATMTRQSLHDLMLSFEDNTNQIQNQTIDYVDNNNIIMDEPKVAVLPTAPAVVAKKKVAVGKKDPLAVAALTNNAAGNSKPSKPASPSATVAIATNGRKRKGGSTTTTNGASKKPANHTTSSGKSASKPTSSTGSAVPAVNDAEIAQLLFPGSSFEEQEAVVFLSEHGDQMGSLLGFLDTPSLMDGNSFLDADDAAVAVAVAAVARQDTQRQNCEDDRDNGVNADIPLPTTAGFRADLGIASARNTPVPQQSAASDADADYHDRHCHQAVSDTTSKKQEDGRGAGVSPLPSATAAACSSSGSRRIFDFIEAAVKVIPVSIKNSSGSCIVGDHMTDSETVAVGGAFAADAGARNADEEALKLVVPPVSAASYGGEHDDVNGDEKQPEPALLTNSSKAEQYACNSSTSPVPAPLLEPVVAPVAVPVVVPAVKAQEFTIASPIRKRPIKKKHLRRITPTLLNSLQNKDSFAMMTFN